MAETYLEKQFLKPEISKSKTVFKIVETKGNSSYQSDMEVEDTFYQAKFKKEFEERLLEGSAMEGSKNENSNNDEYEKLKKISELCFPTKKLKPNPT